MAKNHVQPGIVDAESGACLASGFADDLRRAYTALEDHSHTLDRENEDLQASVNGNMLIIKRTASLISPLSRRDCSL